MREDGTGLQFRCSSRMRFLETLWPLQFLFLPELMTGWHGSIRPRGVFDPKSAYLLATDAIGDAPFNGQWIWKLKTLPRIQMFVWKCMHPSLGVNQCLVARGLPMDACYPRCHREVESILHLLRDCPLSINMWHHLGRQVNSSNFFSLNL